MTTITHDMRIDTDATTQAFNRAALEYDALVTKNPIVQRIRQRAQARMLELWRPGDRILELNCGTGVDAAFLAEHGIRVLATDAADGMVARARERLAAARLEAMTEARVLRFEELTELKGQAFDGVLSMFGGLNCAADLHALSEHLAAVIRPGGKGMLMFIGKYSPWEITASLLRGKLRTAFRRWSTRRITVRVEGIGVLTRYWSVAQLRAIFAPSFTVRRIESYGAVTPPPASRKFFRRFRRLSVLLFTIEERLGSIYPVNRFGDHIAIELVRRAS